MSERRVAVRVARLVVEAGAIFLGVTLGFLADDYRDYLGDRHLEVEALKQLLQDLELDSADVAPMVNQSQTLGAAARWITNQAARGRVPRDSLDLVVDRINATPAFTYEPSSSAYSGLRSTGRIDLVANSELKGAIVRYFEDRQPAVAQINTHWQSASENWWAEAGRHLTPLTIDSTQEYAEWRVRDAASFMVDQLLQFRTAELIGYSSDMHRYAVELLALNRDLRQQVELYLDAR